MGGWVEGWMGGGMDGWVEGWMGGGMDGWRDGWVGGWRDGWMEGWVQWAQVTTDIIGNEVDTKVEKFIYLNTYIQGWQFLSSIELLHSYRYPRYQ